MTLHAIQRISPKGGPFIGRCTRCGMSGLHAEDLSKECPNYTGMSDGEALSRAVLGEWGKP